MHPKPSLERLAEAMERAHRHWEAQRRAESAEPFPRTRASPPWTIALSREAGTRGSLVAQEIGTRLGWPVYDYALLERIAQEMGVRTELLQSVDEQRVSWFYECIQDFAAVPSVHASAYIRHLVEVLLALAAHGHSVIVGRGAAQLLPPASTLRVRLVAPVQERIAVTSRERGLTWEEAADYLDRIDRGRIQFVREHFHKDPTDPQQYDLVVNAGRFSVADCADLVIAALYQVQGHQPEKRLAALRTEEKEVLVGPGS